MRSKKMRSLATKYVKDLVGRSVTFEFLGNASIREMLRFLEAERGTNICITLCIEGILRSRWSVEMTAMGWFLNTTAVSVESKWH